MPEEKRVRVAALLQPVVIALLSLAGIARKAHWNVRGVAFVPLHKLFGELYTAASDHADVIAEHIAMLGLAVEGDHLDVAKLSAITGMPSTVTQGRDLIPAVGSRLTQVLDIVNEPKAELLALGDDDAQQKLLDTSMAISKLGWKILAHVG
jgi:starvation-inducible DNA-binding protein